MLYFPKSGPSIGGTRSEEGAGGLLCKHLELDDSTKRTCMRVSYEIESV